MAQQFLSFVDFLNQQKIRYNKTRFHSESHYRIIIYNRYNVKYKWYCQQKQFQDDSYKYYVEKREYERRLRDFKDK